LLSVSQVEEPLAIIEDADEGEEEDIVQEILESDDEGFKMAATARRQRRNLNEG
jgi:hypothetical protein